ESVTYPTTRPVPLGDACAPVCAAAPPARNVAPSAIPTTARTTEIIVPPISRGCVLRGANTIGRDDAGAGLERVPARHRPISQDHGRFTACTAVAAQQIGHDAACAPGPRAPIREIGWTSTHSLP